MIYPPIVFQSWIKLNIFSGGGFISFLVNLRKLEFAINNGKRIATFTRSLLHRRFENKYHCKIPPNVFGPGIRFEHPIGIIVNPKARIGSNCNIHQFVTIGNDGLVDDAATIGDNCYIGAGCCLIGNIKIGNNCVIGAGAVVTHNFDDNCVLGGVPARIIKK